MNMRLKKQKHKNKLKEDSLLQKINHNSQLLILIVQIMLFILAYYGYVYTVRPVYTKALLEEDIAKKQMQIYELDKKISTYNKNEQIHINKINDYYSIIKHNRNEINKLNYDINIKNLLSKDIENRLNTKKHELDNANIYLNQTRYELKNTYTKLLLSILDQIEIIYQINCSVAELQKGDKLTLASECIGNSIKNNLLTNKFLSNHLSRIIIDETDKTLEKYDKLIFELQPKLDTLIQTYNVSVMAVEQNSKLNKYDKSNKIVGLMQDKNKLEILIKNEYHKILDNAALELRLNLTNASKNNINNNFYMTIIPEYDN